MTKTKLICFVFIIQSSVSIYSQNTFSALVKDSVTNETLFGVSVTIENTNLNAISDANGLIKIYNIPDGNQKINLYLIGYKKREFMIDFPNKQSNSLPIYLVAIQNDLEEITVSSTRTNSRIDDLPTKVEVLGQEDMDEESTIVPSNVSSILGDLSIITIQRTNLVNGNDAIRMQGLDSKYTQIMRDGLPLFGGFSGSLGVLSIPPLDLKQVEIIKGSASTLYGGGAIGGLINFISKQPTDSAQGTIILNATSIGEGNINTFFSGKRKKTGATLFAGANIKQAKDINGDGFTDIPTDKNYSIHPRLFFNPNKKTEIIVGFTTNYDERKGGDLIAVKKGADTIHQFLQKEFLFRNTVDFSLIKHFSKNNSLNIKISGSSFQRNVNYSEFIFNGTQYSSYSEINDLLLLNKHTLVFGINFISENFILQKSDAINFKNYSNQTNGLFFQEDWQVFKKLSLQIGLRYDINSNYGNFLLPRLSLFYKNGPKFSIRLATGSGYKTPNIFDIAEPSIGLQNQTKAIKSENSHGANADINYHTVLFENLTFELNQAFYYTTISNPIILWSDASGNLFTKNDNYTTNSYGTDTYIRLALDEIALYLGYNHTESKQVYSTINFNMPFNPKDKLSSTLSYEIEGKWRAGIEASYSANQYLYNNKKVPNFLFMAAMVERKLKRVSIVLNCENLLDVRQSQYESLIEGTKQQPIIKPLWGPVEGRVFNLSIKLKI